MNTRFLFLILMTACISVTAIRCKEERGLPSVITVAVKDITNTTARCEINVTSDGGGAGEVHGSILFSNVVTEPVWPYDQIGGFGNTGLGKYSETLDYLSPGSVYYVRAVAWNEVGIAYGETLSFTTTGTVTGEIQFNPEVDYGAVTDVEGNAYKTVQIGNQTWMAENLKTQKLNNGTEIQNISDFNAWAATENPALCFYANDEGKYNQNYGALYNWYAVNTGKLCPEGWHVPSDDEWSTLCEYLGGAEEAGHRLQENGLTHWVKTDSMVTNSSGFTALPAGYKGDNANAVHYFFYLGYGVAFWSSTLTQGYEDKFPSHWGMTYQPNNILGEGIGAFINDTSGFFYLATKRSGFSVRCIKD